MSYEQDLIGRLDACPEGAAGWKEFEDLCIEVLTHLFIPPLTRPMIQARTLSGVQRRDAIFPFREFNDTSTNWGKFYKEHGARMILFEFKNYGPQGSLTREDVLQVNSYMREAMGRLAIIVTTKEPEASAYRERMTIYNASQRIILFVTKENLKDMLYSKERNVEPSDMIMDLIEQLYVQQE